MTLKVRTHRAAAVAAPAKKQGGFVAAAKKELLREMTTERKRYPSSEIFWDNKEVNPKAGSEAQRVYDFISPNSGGDGVQAWQMTVKGRPVVVIRGDASLESDEDKNISMIAFADAKAGKVIGYGWVESRWVEGQTWAQNKKHTKAHWVDSHLKPWDYRGWPKVDPS